MKNILAFLMILFFAACSSKEQSTIQTIDLADIPVQQVKFEVLPLDTSKILYPQGIYVFKDHIILMTPMEEHLFTFWDRKTLEYEFSTTVKGQGPNDLTSLNPLYFASSDSSIFVLDRHLEKEMLLDDNQLKTINRTSIVIGNTINGLFKVDDANYIMFGVNNKADCEHYKYDGENISKFGTLPCPAPNESIKEYEVWQFNSKTIAGKQGKNVFFNFYTYLNLVREYDVEGNLLKEIKLEGMPQKENTYSMYLNRVDYPATPYWSFARATEKHVYVLFNQGQTCQELWRDDIETPPDVELQVWNWDGSLEARYKFDKPFSRYIVSEDGIMYAYDWYKGDAVYRYKF